MDIIVSRSQPGSVLDSESQIACANVLAASLADIPALEQVIIPQ